MTTRSLLAAVLATVVLTGCSGGSESGDGSDPAAGTGTGSASTSAPASTGAPMATATAQAASPEEAKCRAKLTQLLRSGALQESDLDTPPAECAGYPEQQLVRFLGEELQAQMQQQLGGAATP